MMTFCCLAAASAGQVYRWVGPDGVVQYSDRPYAGAEIIVTPEWPPPQPRHFAFPPREAAVEAEPAGYAKLAIVAPRRGETIRDNEGNVTVAFSVEPEIDEKEGHRIQILLDGQARGEPSASLEQQVTGVTRGSHRISARLIDVEGRVLVRSPSISFYLMRSSPLFHPPRPGAPAAGVQQAPRAPMAPRAPRAPHAPFVPAPSTPTPPPGPT